MEHFLFPNSSGNLRSDAHQSQIIGGDVDVDHTQIIGGGTVKLLMGIYPPIPPGFRHRCWWINPTSVFWLADDVRLVDLKR